MSDTVIIKRRTVVINDFGDIIRLPRHSWIDWLKIVAKDEAYVALASMPGAKVLFHTDGHTDLSQASALFELEMMNKHGL